jgi:hypothetical protein
MSLVPAAMVLLQGLWIGPKYDRYVLPAFDGYVYDAMAESPRVFTVAPWGYRILAPTIVHLLPFPSAAEGFFWLNLALLTAAVFAVGAWLRRLGFTPMVAFLGGLSLAITPPVRAVLEYQVLVDPLSLILFIAILNEFIAPRGLVLGALFALGALTKEVCLLPLLALPFAMSERQGWKQGPARSLAIAAPAVGLAAFLRATWGGETALRSVAVLGTVLSHAAQVPWPSAALFVGATFVGLRGFRAERSMAIRAAGVLLWFGCFLAVLANPYGFAPADLPRIALFAWTPVLPLVLIGLGFDRDHTSPPAARSNRTLDVVAVFGLLGAAALVIGTDSYRRAPQAEPLEPITYLARSRETIKTARFLDDGNTFVFDSRSGRFAGPVTERFNLTEGRQHRWFLFDGFGRDAVFESGAPEFRDEARLLLPILTPRNATMTIDLEGPTDTLVKVSVAGRNLATLKADAPGVSFQVPAVLLIRGDNLLTLQAPEGSLIRLMRFEVRLESSGRP